MVAVRYKNEEFQYECMLKLFVFWKQEKPEYIVKFNKTNRRKLYKISKNSVTVTCISNTEIFISKQDNHTIANIQNEMVEI